MLSTRLPHPDRRRSAGLALGLAACGSAEGGTDDASGPIKIGVVVPLTGPFSPLGTGDKAAIEQEVARINADGGVLGRDLEVTIKDDKTDVPQSVTEYNQMAADQSYTAILSSSHVGASTAIGPSAETNKIPTIALGPVSAFKDGSNDYAFTCVAIPELYAEAMVDYIKAEGYRVDRHRPLVGGPLRPGRQRRHRRGGRGGGHRRGGRRADRPRGHRLHRR